MTYICVKEELSNFDLDGKWNDYIGLQKEVLTVLRNEKYFERKEVINAESKMLIKINAKGIRETLGNGNRFQTLPKKFKVYKIATIRHLPEIIRTGHMIEADVENSHSENGYHYAYINNIVKIDGEEFGVRVAIRKKIASNQFWIHNIDEKKL